MIMISDDDHWFYCIFAGLVIGFVSEQAECSVYKLHISNNLSRKKGERRGKNKMSKYLGKRYCLAGSPLSFAVKLKKKFNST